MPIFTGIDETGCTREFEFGQDGKPLYVNNGPYDSPAFQRRIRETLDRTAGPGNWRCVVATGDPSGTSVEALDGDSEDDEYLDEDDAEGEDESGPSWGDVRPMLPK